MNPNSLSKNIIPDHEFMRLYNEIDRYVFHASIDKETKKTTYALQNPSTPHINYFINGLHAFLVWKKQKELSTMKPSPFEDEEAVKLNSKNNKPESLADLMEKIQANQIAQFSYILAGKIISKKSKAYLDSIIEPINRALEKEVFVVIVVSEDDYLKQFNYESYINFKILLQKHIELLAENEYEIGKYHIYNLKIALNRIYKTNDDRDKAFYYLSDKISIPIHRCSFDEQSRRVKYSTNNTELNIYPGTSEIVPNMISINYDWKLKKSNIIKDKTGISKIRDLLTIFSQEKLYEQLDNKFVYEIIDYEQLGKYLVEKEWLEDYQLGTYSEIGHFFCDCHNIVT